MNTYLNGRTVIRFVLALIVAVFTATSTIELGQLGPPRAVAQEVRLLTRDEAIAIALQRLFPRVDPPLEGSLGAFARLLQPGDIVRPLFPPEGVSPEAKTFVIAFPTWFFFVDTSPFAKFAHPVAFVLLLAIACTPEEIQIDPLCFRGATIDGTLDWWPIINEVPVYDTDRERAETPDRFELSPATASPVPSVLSFAAAERPTAPPLFSLHESGTIMADVACPQETVRKVAVVVQASTEGAMKNDADAMETELNGAGFTVSRFSVDTHPNLTQIQEGVRTAGAELGECDKFLLYISAHGNNDAVIYYKGDPLDAQAIKWSYDPLDEGSIPRILGNSVKAGHINLIIDACKAGAVSFDLARIFSGVPDKTVTILDKKEVNVFTAADQGRAALVKPLQLLPPRWEAGIYTDSLAKDLKRLRESGQLDTNVSVAEFEAAFVVAELGGEIDARVFAQQQGKPDPKATAVSLKAAVRLDHTLSTEAEELMQFATIVLDAPGIQAFESHVIGGSPERSALHCDGMPHLHAANPEGIKVQLSSDGVLKEFGPFPDPDPSNCGYGSIVARAVKLHP